MAEAKQALVKTTPPPLVKLRKTNDSVSRGITGIIYCPPGIGNTSLLRTVEPHYDSSDVLFINIDAGDAVINDIEISTLDISPSTDVRLMKAMYQQIVTGQCKPRLVFLDSISEMENYMRNIITSGRGKSFPTIKEFGDSAFKLREYLRLYRSLRDLGIDVIFCALEQDMDIQNDTNGVVTKCVPYVSKKMVIDVCAMVDFVAHMEKDDKTEVRWFRLESNDRFIAKKRFPWLEKFEKPSLGELMVKIKAGGSNKLPMELDPEGDKLARSLEGENK